MKKLKFSIKDLHRSRNGYRFSKNAIEKAVGNSLVLPICVSTSDNFNISSLQTVGIAQIVSNYPDIYGEGFINNDYADSIKRNKLNVSFSCNIPVDTYDYVFSTEITNLCLVDKNSNPYAEAIIEDDE